MKGVRGRRPAAWLRVGAAALLLSTAGCAGGGDGEGGGEPSGPGGDGDASASGPVAVPDGVGEIVEPWGDLLDDRWVAVTADGAVLATCGGSVCRWDADGTLEGFAGSGPVAGRADGASLAVGSGPTVVLLDRTGAPVGALGGHERVGRSGDVEPSGGYQLDDISLAEDADVVASTGGDGRVVVGDTATGEVLTTIEVDGAQPLSVSLSPAGDSVAVTYATGPGRVFDTADGEEVGVLGDPDGPREEATVAVAHSPDGRWLAVADRTGRTVLHDAATLEPGPELVDASGGHLAWAPDSGSLAVSGTGALRVATPAGDDWSAAEVVALADGPVVGAVTYSPDGSRLHGVAAREGAATWDAGTGELLDVWSATSPDE